MRNTRIGFVIGLSAAALLAGCSTTARYVTTEHWSGEDTFYVGYTEYTETNLLITKTGSSSAHVMMCRASGDNQVQCKPQVAVDRLLNPDEDYPEPPPPPAPAPAETEEPPAVTAADGIPNV